MTAYYNEIDRGAAAWLRELIKAGVIAPGVVDERDIRDVPPRDLVGFTQCHFFAGIGIWSHALRLAGWPDTSPVWTGSCPCQPFSAAGKGLGFADERHLWPAWFHLIEEHRPPVIFGEQVASQDGLAWLDLVRADLEGADYACGAVDTCAAGFGAPHIRQRLWWVADTTGPRCQREIRESEGQAWDEARLLLPSERSKTGGLADPNNAERRPTMAGGNNVNGNSPGRFKGDGESREHCEADELGNSHARGLQQSHTHLRARGSHKDLPVTRRPGAVNAFWAAAEWVYCRDEKFRPVEPGSFPLAHGAPAHVGRLRGYGNAIVAAAAKEMILAYRQPSKPSGRQP